MSSNSAGKVFEEMCIEGRLTVCNMSIEAGARAGLVAADETTFSYLKGRPYAPKGADWDKAVAWWKSLATEPGARFDKSVVIQARDVQPTVTWGTSPEDTVAIGGVVPSPASFADPSKQEAAQVSLDYMGLTPGTRMQDIEVQNVFIGSCTNSRIEDLRAAAAVLRGRHKAAGVKWAIVVPGSGLVKAQAEAEGLDKVFTDAGLEWREPGCSACLGMNPDKVPPGRTLRIDQQPQLHRAARTGRADTSGLARDGGGGGGDGQVDGCAGVGGVRRSSRIAVPLKRPGDVIPHLGRPSHWKQGYSAKSLAEAWFFDSDIPFPIRALLEQSEQLAGAQFLEAWLERETDLQDSRGTPTQTDLLALLGIGEKLAVLGIEAKVKESFDKRVTKWLESDSEGKTQRLAQLCDLFQLDPAQVGHLRYQLFHRTAATILEAKRFRSDKAIMIVHSFCTKSKGLSDARAFFEAIGLPGLEVGKLLGPKQFDGVDLWIGWAYDTIRADA